MKYWLLTITGLLLSTSVLAEPLTFTSGKRQNTMIELFTSEGCSSCPPAENYLNHYLQNPRLWKDYFPVALHVDYWDYLGWPDRFARADHSNRQRRYAREQRAATVFTPAFFINGTNWRPGLFDRAPGLSEKTVGVLRTTVNGNRIDASFDPVAPVGGKLQLHAGILGFGLHTQIRRGENAGRSSAHEFVLLDSVPLRVVAPGRWHGRLPTAPSHQAGRYGLVVWASSPHSQAPIQVTGGWLPDRVFAQAIKSTPIHR